MYSNILLNFDNNNIIIPICDLYIQTKNMIFDMYILAGNYNPQNKTLYNYLNTDDLYFLAMLINKSLINRRNAVDTQNFKHGDFKTNNILVKEDFNIYLFDLDFSVIVNNNDKIKLKYCEKVNFYLDLDSEREISGLFLDLFDIYLLSLSIVYGSLNKIKIINLLECFKDILLNQSDMYCDDFYTFYITFTNIYIKFPKIFNYDTYLDFARYDLIYDILSDLQHITIELKQDIRYIKAIDFIEKALVN